MAAVMIPQKDKLIVKIGPKGQKIVAPEVTSASGRRRRISGRQSLDEVLVRDDVGLERGRGHQLKRHDKGRS